jgi:hypothetical protein
MIWDVGPKVRAHVVGFTGINFSGFRMEVDLFPTGTQKGEIDGRRLKCIGMIAPIATRLTIFASSAEQGWETLPWRSFTILDGFTFQAHDGKRVGVQVPDLDVLDNPDALRTDPDFSCSYPEAPNLTDGKGWTFGCIGQTPLKCNVRRIRVERMD